MGLGRREARHQTVGAARTAGVDPSIYWDFKPGQRVMTVDGFPGKVVAVNDGPFAGNEDYEVALDNGMGGGTYTASLLRPLTQSEASHEKTAADDYPELGDILVTRPPLELAVTGSNKFHESDGGAHEHDTERCVQHLKDDGHDEESAIRICKDRHKKKSSKTARVGDANEYFEAEQTNLGKAPAQAGEGDYTNDFHCPSCGGSRALKGVNTLKCENCGYLNKTSGALPQEQAQGATCKDCGLWHHAAKPGDTCPLCEGQMSKHPEKYSSLGLLVLAAADPSFRFHVTATFADVRNKAKRLRSEGKVSIAAVSDGVIAGHVKGDHAVYETTLTRSPGKMQSIAQWSCGCKWASYSWGRSGAFKKFEGRLCSHALALQLEAQSRGMFGRSVNEDKMAPDWMRPRTRVVVQYDKDTGKNVSRPASPRKRDLQRTYAAVQAEQAPADLILAEASQSYDLDEIVLAFRAAGIDGRTAAIKTDPEPPKSHHRNRSSDLTPCARGGCGHPEGIHGEEGGNCQSPGCTCTHYQGPGKTSSLDAGYDTRRKTQHSNTHNVPKSSPSMSDRGSGRNAIAPGGYGSWWHGIGYGVGYCGTPGCETHNGYSGDGVLADAAGGGDSIGDGGGGGSSESSLRVRAQDENTTQTNQTPGISNGFWDATRPRLRSENPGSAGFASTGDPDNWKGVGTNSISDRMASLASLSDEEWDEAGAQFLATHKEAVAPLVALAPFAAPAAGAAGRFLVQKALPKVAPKVKDVVVKNAPKAKDKIDDLIDAATKAKPKGGKPQKPQQKQDQKPQQKQDQKGQQKQDKKPGRVQRAKNKMKGRGLPVIPLPGLGNGDYYRETGAQVGQFSVRAMSEDDLNALEADFQREADLTPQQEFANGVADNLETLGGPSLHRYEDLASEMASAERSKTEATLNDEPEAALPQTDGEGDDGDALGAHLFTGATVEEPRAIPVTEPSIDFAHEPDDQDFQTAASLDTGESVDDIVAQFQATAGKALLESRPKGGDESDVASAARAHLAKEAMKTFSPAEQKQIIDEGMDVKASNLDLLKIEGTHYEALEAALASMPEDDDLELA